MNRGRAPHITPRELAPRATQILGMGTWPALTPRGARSAFTGDETHRRELAIVRPLKNRGGRGSGLRTVRSGDGRGERETANPQRLRRLILFSCYLPRVMEESQRFLRLNRVADSVPTLDSAPEDGHAVEA